MTKSDEALRIDAKLKVEELWRIPISSGCRRCKRSVLLESLRQKDRAV